MKEGERVGNRIAPYCFVSTARMINNAMNVMISCIGHLQSQVITRLKLKSLWLLCGNSMVSLRLLVIPLLSGLGSFPLPVFQSSNDSPLRRRVRDVRSRALLACLRFHYRFA